MSKILTESELHEIVSAGKIIKHGSMDSVEGIKYDFRLGTNILLSGGREVNTEKLTETERSDLHLEPGEMAFVLSEEWLELPINIKVELSHKRKLSHRGILVHGGICVDPYYQGWLVFLLYNFSSTRFPLKPHNKLIAGIFYKLDDDEAKEPKKKPTKLKSFPDDVVTLMADYIPFSPKRFDSAIEGLKKRFGKLEDTIREGEQWRQDFRRGLDELKDSLKDIASKLNTEIELRASGEKTIEKRQDKFEEGISDIRTSVKISKIFWSILGAIGLVLLAVILESIFDFIK